ncbi:hypothetical protein R3P38DRAFT_2786869 [Favolaschia claudopus]|uniref:Uncharacterized protein n=1 Tax=Favolaschia claudopus TaxID=2862362 RepID=A0AAW0APZ1_9AGAR
MQYLEALFSGDGNAIADFEEDGLSVSDTANEHRDEYGRLALLELQQLKCTSKFRIFEPVEEHRAECPYILVICHGAHTHPTTWDFTEFGGNGDSPNLRSRSYLRICRPKPETEVYDGKIESQNNRLRAAYDSKLKAEAQLASLYGTAGSQMQLTRAQNAVSRANEKYHKALTASMESVGSGSGKVGLLLPSKIPSLPSTSEG